MSNTEEFFCGRRKYFTPRDIENNFEGEIEGEMDVVSIYYKL